MIVSVLLLATTLDVLMFITSRSVLALPAVVTKVECHCKCPKGRADTDMRCQVMRRLYGSLTI